MQNHQQNISKPYPNIYGYIPGMQGFTNIHESNIVIHHINKLKNKSHTIISIDAEKDFDKIQHLFLIKSLQRFGLEVKGQNSKSHI